MLKDAIKGTWKETKNWLIWNLVCSLLPVWGGILILITFSIKPHFSDFSKNGQFTIYSAAMLAAAMYVTYKDYKFKLPGKNILGLLSILGLITSTILFSVVTSVDIGKTIIELNRSFIQYSSLIIYIISIIVTFILISCDLHMERINILEQREKDLESLDKGLSKLEN